MQEISIFVNVATQKLQMLFYVSLYQVSPS